MGRLLGLRVGSGQASELSFSAVEIEEERAGGGRGSEIDREKKKKKGERCSEIILAKAWYDVAEPGWSWSLVCDL